MCANFEAKRTTLSFLTQICPEMAFWSEILKTNIEIRIDILEIPCVPIFRQNEQVWFFWPKFAQKWISGRNFKNLSLHSKSVPPIYHVCQFSVKMDSFKFFGLNLGKLPNYVRYFGSNNVEGVAESWVETEMSWLGVDGAGWSWVEVDGAGWRWVHGLVKYFKQRKKAFDGNLCRILERAIWLIG